ncbi:MAG: lactate racemase domain-containing protein [Pirellulales bacterium]
MTTRFPRMFRVQQRFPAPRVERVSEKVHEELQRLQLHHRVQAGQSVAITVGSRGIHGIATIIRAVVDHCYALGAKPFLVPAMGSHGGGTAEGQVQLLSEFGVTEETMGCPIRSSMETIVVCTAKEGFPVHFDRFASEADHVLVVNRIKPHTRFHGAIESGLMKMMLIGLGKHQGALVYHRIIMNYSFDQIVRSVAREVIAKCKILAGLAILENADEETAELVGVLPEAIESTEPSLLERVKSYMPRLPFDHAQLLIVDQIGKNISGTGMDTNVIGRKFNDHACTGGERPNIHLIYVRSLTHETHGNASGIGIAELCHRRVIDTMDVQVTRINCITAGHITAGMIPLDYPSDRQALEVALSQAGWCEPQNVPIQWIHNTLKLGEVECSEAYWQEAQSRSDLILLEEPREILFNRDGDFEERFADASHA